MKKKAKNTFVFGLLTASAALVFAGCSVSLTKDEFVSKNDLTTEVVYYANGGCFDDDFEKVVKTVWYKANSYAYEITEEGINGEQFIEYADYEFLGWYYAQLGGDGLPLKEEDGSMRLGEAVPFDQPIETWTTTHIVASWASLSKVKVKLVIGGEGDPVQENETIEIKTRFGNDYAWKVCQTGDEIRDYSFVNGFMQSTTTLTLEVKDNAYTFLNFYSDEACTQSVAWPLVQPDKNAAEKDVYIYAKYIKGNWKMLSLPKDVSNMFSSPDTNNKNTRYFLKNDIDCSILNEDVTPRVRFNCELKGNGYTISGLKTVKEQLDREYSYALLGTLGANAKITGVTFADLEMHYKSSKDAYVYFVFTSIEEGAVMENVAFSGTIILDFAKCEVKNNTETNWKFGGFETDDAYTGGCTVDGKILYE